jgi:cytochrome c553
MKYPAALALLLLAAAPSPPWPFPGYGNTGPDVPPNPARILRLPKSPVTFTEPDLHGMARAIDWFPAAHPPAPAAVLRKGAGDAYPCGYCHLADGSGRPENARLQGLPVAYILAQVAAFASGARRAASADYVPTQYMAAVAHAVSADDLRQAATYFSGFEPQSHTEIVEAEAIPAATPWRFVYRFDPSHTEPLGQRIVEGPTDPDRFELRDPGTHIIAYVPRGAIARGQAIAQHGLPGVPACETCHGAALGGIAGASPTYLARQLMAFRAKTRNDPAAAPMQAVAAPLTDAQIIDATAYVASRRPWTRAELTALEK